MEDLFKLFDLNYIFNSDLIPLSMQIEVSEWSPVSSSKTSDFAKEWFCSMPAVELVHFSYCTSPSYISWWKFWLCKANPLELFDLYLSVL